MYFKDSHNNRVLVRETASTDLNLQKLDLSSNVLLLINTYLPQSLGSPSTFNHNHSSYLQSIFHILGTAVSTLHVLSLSQ